MMVRIENTPRSYAWGSTTAIAELLGTEVTGEPQAELWFGAHAGSPARIIGGAPEGDLAQWALKHRPDGRLPFLMKVLAASSPLSLQAHPTLQQARDGFARENAAGVPPDAPDRNYKDAWHKPELLYALSDPFRALSGFRPVEESRRELAAVGDARLTPLLDQLTGEEALRPVMTWLIEQGDGVDSVVAALSEYAASLAGELRDSPTWDTVRRLSAHYPGDSGIAISTLMHTVVLAPGEAIYLPAGNIHAYLDGLGIEVMAASDNVLRGGLTPKHIDVPELMSVLDFRSLPAPYLTPEHPQAGVSVFRPDVADFALTIVEGEALTGGVAIETGGAAIALVLEGDVVVVDGAQSEQLQRGGAVFTDAVTIAVRGRGRLALGRVGS